MEVMRGRLWGLDSNAWRTCGGEQGKICITRAEEQHRTRGKGGVPADETTDKQGNPVINAR